MYFHHRMQTLLCLHPRYIYMRSWLYSRCTALLCQILAPIPGWPVPQVARPMCPWWVPMCPLPVQPIMNPTWVTLLHLILPPGAPQKHAPPHPQTHLPFVCVLVCSQGPIENAVPCVEGSLFEASEGCARYCAAVALWQGQYSLSSKTSLALVATVGLQQHLLPSLSCARIT